MGRRPDPADPAFVATLGKREARERTGLFYVEGFAALRYARGGRRPAATLLAAPGAAETLAAEGWDGDLVVPVAPADLARISDVKIHEGAIGVFRAERPGAGALAASGARRILLAEDVADPANVAGLLRLCDAFGYALLAAGRTADPFGPRAARASMGGIFHVDLAFAAEPLPAADALAAAGYALVGTPCAGGVPPEEVPPGAPRLALCVGGETRGMSAALLERCPRLVTLPLAGRVQSLNVTHAAAILMRALAA